jgi:hypothetical protein
MPYTTKQDRLNELTREKLIYIINNHIDGGKKTLAIKTFGYKKENVVSNFCSKNVNSYLKKLHMESIERHHHIPISIWDREFPFDTELIDKEIKKYQSSLNQGAINIETKDTIFQKNEQLFKKLKGIWYAYLYPSNPNSAKETEGVWIVETEIYDDYTVIDQWGNKGYLKLGKQESLIIKESYENNDLTVIRFQNRQVPFENFRFTIVSNQNFTIHEMVNFGFYSRKKYTPKEAKKILGDMKKVQLKLDLEFEERLRARGVVKV